MQVTDCYRVKWPDLLIDQKPIFVVVDSTL